MLIQRKRIPVIVQALDTLLKHARGVKLTYGLAKNRGLLQPELEAIQKAGQPSKEYLEFAEKWTSYTHAAAVKDLNGQAILQGGNFLIGDPKIYKEVLDPLRAQYAAAIAARDKQVEQLTAFLDEMADIAIHCIPAALLEAENAFDAAAPPLGEMYAPLIGTIFSEG